MDMCVMCGETDAVCPHPHLLLVYCIAGHTGRKSVYLAFGALGLPLCLSIPQVYPCSV